MNLVIAVVCAAGVWLFFSGLPLLRHNSLTSRVEPYLNSSHGARTRRGRTHARGDLRAWARARVAAQRLPGGSDLERRLAAAGSALSPEDFRLEQVAWGGVGLLLFVFTASAAAAAGVDVDVRALPVLAALSFAIGYVGRDQRLSRDAGARRARLLEELPVAVDLLALAVMSGESIPAAVGRVGAKVGGAIGAELSAVDRDVKAGATVGVALASLARRIPDAAVARMVDSLTTAIERGAPVAEVLRAHADDLRDRRRQRMIELGAKREILMLIPVVFLIMPVVIVFALFPGLVTLDLLVP